MSAPVAKALWSHYKRHPFQVLLVWLGLTLGIALLVGVMVINQHARQSYHHSERLFSSPFSYVVMPRNPDSKMPQGLTYRYAVTDSANVSLTITWT